jgi:hypothetical protein
MLHTNTTKLGRILACGLIAGAISAPAASAFTPGEQDFRSPDAIDSARMVERQQSQDLVSPDARDSASNPGVSTYATSEPQQSSASSGGFDWSTAGISAAAAMGLLILSIGTLTAVRHRHA